MKIEEVKKSKHQTPKYVDEASAGDDLWAHTDSAYTVDVADKRDEDYIKMVNLSAENFVSIVEERIVGRQ